MESAVKELVTENDKQRVKLFTCFTNWKFITTSIILIIALIIGAINYYQAKYFNAHITINGIKVGGLTADQALEKLSSLKALTANSMMSTVC